MIPRKIHYCWLSGKKIPPELQKCLNSWKEIMPDYELKCWDKSHFNIRSVVFVEEACKVGKWAFAADYIRMYALYVEGGVYLDIDVLVKKRFDEFLPYDFFSSVEYHPAIIEMEKSKNLLNEDGASKHPSTFIPGIGIQASVLGGTAEHPFFKDCLDYYGDKHFILGNGIYFNKFLSPTVYAMAAEKYGFKYIDQSQLLKNNMLLLPSVIFAGTPEYAKDESYTIHFSAGSWKPREPLAKRILIKIKKNTFLRKIFKKRPLQFKQW